MDLGKAGTRKDMSALTFIAIAALVLAGLGLNWCARRLIGPQYARRAAARRFAREFAELAAGTELDLAALRGPAHGSAAMAAYAEPTSDVRLLEPRTLSLEDQDYYATSWRNVRGEFAVSPPSALVLATHLTANLLLNRGLLPVDTARPTLLPETWTFASARGYRDALGVCSRTDAEDVPKDELTKALTQFEDFYFEMLTLSP
ncbi:MAG TPA: hypothetical protein VFN97_04000 [Actinospica sp.]|nr:hypothetical protein [Actinospica sp.]